MFFGDFTETVLTLWGSPVPQSQSREELGGGVLSFETEPKELGLTVGPHMISWVSVGCSGTQESPELGPAGLVVTAKSSQARTGPDLSSLRTGINRSLLTGWSGWELGGCKGWGGGKVGEKWVLFLAPVQGASCCPQSGRVCACVRVYSCVCMHACVACTACSGLRSPRD